MNTELLSPGREKASGYELRPYQQAAAQGVFRSWQEYDRSLVIMPTAAGKTVVFAAIAEQRSEAGRVLVLAHTDELIGQAIDKLYRARGLLASKEKASDRADLDAGVVVGSVQTLARRRRLERFARTHFATVIVDEAHHALAETYQRILAYFVGHKTLGCTATPDRGDCRDLGQYFQDIAYEISLVDLIKAGYLCPVKVQTVPIEIDLRGVSIRVGDFSEEELAARLEPALEELAEAIVSYAVNRKTLIFVPLVRIAVQFAESLRECGLAAEMVSGACSDRAEKLARFRSGETRILVNAMLLAEGFDEPSLDCVVPLRPTRIRSLYAQQIGRGTRIHPGKENLLLLDFLWLSRSHDLVRPVSLIARDEAEAEGISQALEGGSGDLLEAQHASQAKREEALARELEQNRQRRGELVDLLELASRYSAPELVDYEPVMHWHWLPVTEAQVEMLRKHSINPRIAKNRGHAFAILQSVFAAKEREPATKKQLHFLRFLGHPHPFARPMTKREAGRLIAELKARRLAIIQPV